MEDEDIVNNVFYILLKNQFRYKHDQAISKCSTICVPSSKSLRGITITEEFINGHILNEDPTVPNSYKSWNGDDYYLTDDKIEPMPLTNGNNPTGYNARILFREQSLNNEYRTYTILILDKPINPTSETIEHVISLDQNIVCYKDAYNFLNEVSDHSSLSSLEIELTDIDVSRFSTAQQLREKLKDLSREHWAKTMRTHALELQRDARFQSQLIKSIEIFTMHHLHHQVYASMVQTLNPEDQFVNSKLEELHRLNVTPDQLGFTAPIQVELPSAIIELSNLDCAEGPWEKFVCLRNCLDLAIAEFKGIFADVKTASDEGNQPIDTRHSDSILSADVLVQLLVYVIVMSRPLRLITDLHYVQNFLWSVAPRDSFTCTLAAFEAAVSVIYKIKLTSLPKQRVERKKELNLKDIMEMMQQRKHSGLNRNMHDVLGRLERLAGGH